MDNLDKIAEDIRTALEGKNAARENLISTSRTLVRHCANAIRAMHRQEWDNAQQLLDTAHAVMDQMRTGVETYPDLYFAGYTQDSFKEYVEAVLAYAMVRNEPLPTPQDLRIEESTYLNGMAEAASELRRYILDILRRDHSDEVERLLIAMESIYDLLVTFDFPDAVSGGLRHRTDNLRGVLERTRGDVTTSLRQQRLEAALARAEGRGKPRLPDAPKSWV
ncbi:MAG: haloacid dehalogenase [Chloroflexota bacterium]